jgi:hypothetical protein
MCASSSHDPAPQRLRRNGRKFNRRSADPPRPAMRQQRHLHAPGSPRARTARHGEVAHREPGERGQRAQRARKAQRPDRIGRTGASPAARHRPAQNSAPPPRLAIRRCQAISPRRRTMPRRAPPIASASRTSSNSAAQPSAMRASPAPLTPRVSNSAATACNRGSGGGGLVSSRSSASRHHASRIAPRAGWVELATTSPSASSIANRHRTRAAARPASRAGPGRGRAAR